MNEAPAEAPSAAAKEDDSASMSLDPNDEGPQLALAYHPVDWEAKIADPVLVDDSLDSVVPSRETQSKFYHEALKSKYHLLEWRGIKPLDIFLKEAIYSLQDQENILRLWLGYGENADSLRRGEELFYFLDEEDVGTSVFEKFVSFHMTVADQNHFGEINFAEFVRMYQLLAVSYQTKDSVLGSLMCHRGSEGKKRAPSSPSLAPFASRPPLVPPQLVARPPSPFDEHPADEIDPNDPWRAERASVLARLEYFTFEEGEFVFKQDDPLTHIIFVFSGRIQTYRTTKDKQKQIIGTIGSGAYVGAIEFITHRPMVRSGIALQRTYVVKLPVDGFEAVLKHEENVVWTTVNSTLMNIRNVQTVLQSEALSLRAGQAQRPTADPLPPSNNKSSSNATGAPAAAAASSATAATSTPTINVPAPSAASSSSSTAAVPAVTSEHRERTSAVLLQTFGGKQSLVTALLDGLAAGKCQRMRLKTGEYLFRRGDESTAIYVLLSGEATRILSMLNHKEVHLYPSFLIGDFALLSGQDQPNDVRCLSRCTFLVIPKAFLVELTHEDHLVLLDFVRPMIENISAHLAELEYAYEYFLLRNGEHLIKPSDPTDCFYFLINGRLREHRLDSQGRASVVVREFSSPGTTIGISRLLLGTPHTTFTTAVRDTELVRFDKAWVTQLMRTNPAGIQSLIKTSLMHDDAQKATHDMPEKSAPKRLIAVIPLSNDVPVQGFTMNLGKVLRQSQGSVKVVTEENILRRFGKIRNVSLMATERSNIWYYISEMEKKHDYVLCVAKPNLSPWTRWILQQVDTVILLAHESCDHSRLSEWETTLDVYNSVFYMAEKRLVVMHRPGGGAISGTNDILQRRRQGIGAVQFHHHVTESNRFHYQSIARFLSGTAVGLVLGGGGARGLAHVGAVLALREAGIPIDIVGGTSMGAQIGGLLAAEMPVADIAYQMRKAYLWATGATRFVDVTFPYLSLLSGRLWTTRMRTDIGLSDRRIEDLPVPFFCVSCNISKLSENIHSEGLLWQAARASSSMPLLFPPFITEEGDALVDGGYVNNVPADVMKKKYGANYVIAVDVYDSSKITNMKGLYEAGSISGWRILFDTIWSQRRYASMHELLLQLSGIVDHTNSPKRQRYIDMFVRPDLLESKGFTSGWSEFVSHDDFIRSGYQQTKDQLELLRLNKPDVYAAISAKVAYPKEQSTYRFDSPANVPKRSALESLMLVIFSRKFILLLLLTGGVYKYVTAMMSFFVGLYQSGSLVKMLRARSSRFGRALLYIREKFL